MKKKKKEKKKKRMMNGEVQGVVTVVEMYAAEGRSGDGVRHRDQSHQIRRTCMLMSTR